ncbi:MAG: glycosyltransferase [Acidobacteriales bacterium]|nr:glycosyltransferase [Terriglobales bacterium]
MRVGFYSPLPPQRTGVADYSAALLGALQRMGRVEVDAQDADVCLYHLGNNNLHREIYKQALQRPGIVVLHDAVLQHFYLGTLDEASYIEEFVYNYGEWSRDLAADLWRGRARSAQDARYFDYPMLRRVAEVSRAIVVHNPAAAAAVLRQAPRARVVEIPHLFVRPPAPPAAEVVRLRENWQVAPGTFLFGVFGYLRESKRLWSVLDAYARVREAGIDAALLIAGEFVSSDLERAIAPALSRPGIVRAGFMSEEDFWRAAHSVDACVNLRHPAGGETSGITVRLMGIGKPVVTTDSSENSSCPPEACLRVPAGVAEPGALAETMIWLTLFPRDARRIGLRAGKWIAEHHALDTVAARYWKLLCDLHRSF